MASSTDEGQKQIIRLFFCRMKESFLNLPEPEKLAFMAKDRANLDALGMKAISMIDCNAMDNEWDYIGVEGWPSMEAIQEREKFEIKELQLSSYAIYETILGQEMSYENYGD